MITPALALSNTRDILEAIAVGKGPTSFIITLGCAGWGPGQLESEIKENAWLTYPVFEENIFELPIESRWEEAVKKIGINPTLLSGAAGHA
jgi:putative transcriptional regulator